MTQNYLNKQCISRSFIVLSYTGKTDCKLILFLTFVSQIVDNTD